MGEEGRRMGQMGEEAVVEEGGRRWTWPNQDGCHPGQQRHGQTCAQRGPGHPHHRRQSRRSRSRGHPDEGQRLARPDRCRFGEGGEEGKDGKGDGEEGGGHRKVSGESQTRMMLSVCNRLPASQARTRWEQRTKRTTFALRQWR